MRKIPLVLGLIVLLFSAGFSQAPLITAWNVTFTFDGGQTTIQTRFAQFADRTGFLRFNTPAATVVPLSFPAVWDRPDTGVLTFTSEVRFPDGPTGTLIFKGRLRSTSRVSGPVIFVSDIPGPSAGAPFLTRVGTFTAVPALTSTP